MEAARSVNWFSSPETTPRATCPTEVFVRFAATHFKPPASFVDIGAGSCANAKWLDKQGFRCTAIDPALEAEGADYHETAETFFQENSAYGFKYDCIYDILTLCHVENPPYEAIRKALKPEGKFFSIVPALDTEWDISGKGFTRLSSEESLRHALRGFSEVIIGPYCYPHRGRNHTHWVVEARP